MSTAASTTHPAEIRPVRRLFSLEAVIDHEAELLTLVYDLQVEIARKNALLAAARAGLSPTLYPETVAAIERELARV
jgi:hypothetical protein